MKRIQSIRAKLGGLALVLVFLFAALIHRPAEAAEFKKPVFAYGQSLTEEERAETRRLLDVAEDAVEIEVRIDELNGLLQNDYPFYQAYSSVYLEPVSTKQGVEVTIVTPSTITAITERQYENAAITAGAINMNIRVASVKAVDGSGALAGVYKAFSDQGQKLSEVNIRVAQKELEVTSAINEENRDKDGYSDDLLNAAIAEIKGEIQKLKGESGNRTEINITNIVNTVINNYNLQNILSEENKQQIEGLMADFSKIEFTEEQKNAIADFGQSILDKGGQILDSVKSGWEGIDPEVKSGISGFLQGLLDFLANIFRSIVDGIKGLF